MPILDSTPFTDAPFALQALWNKFALSGEVDARNPPVTVQEAYNQVVEIQLRHMGEVMEELNEDVNAFMAESEDGLRDANLRRKLAVCTECGARDLEHFYTSKQGGSMLCPTCYQSRVKRGVIQEPDAHHR